MKTDRQIQKDVITELEWDPSVNASDIGVSVKNGIVTLSGQVSSYVKKIAAEKAAKRIAEVRGIAEDIIVKLPNLGKRTDADLADTIIRALRWSSSIPDDTIKVKVENAWVTLEGYVTWNFQKRQAAKLVESIIGITGVTNLILIKPLVTTTVVKEEIKRALDRSAEIEASQIQVETIGNTVILRGKARTWNERNEVEHAAWSAPGVVDVANHLEIA